MPAAAAAKKQVRKGAAGARRLASGSAAAAEKGGRRKPGEFVFEKGLVMEDMKRNKYVLGSQFSKGGFGVLYTGKHGHDDVAIKLEPKSNGPLFCEVHFYSSPLCKAEPMREFCVSRSLAHLAVPRSIGMGFHTVAEGAAEYRFLALPLFGPNLDCVLRGLGDDAWTRQRALLCVQVLHQVLFALWYLHEHDYVHADVKDTNIVFDRLDPRRVFLIDYGLALKYRFGKGKNQPYLIRPKNRHEGTLEYTSEDRHAGASTSRRSDLEVLCYVLVDLLAHPAGLPWRHVATPEHVMNAKVAFKANAAKSVAALMAKLPAPAPSMAAGIAKLCNAVFALDYQDTPPYQLISDLFDQLATICRGRPATGGAFKGLIDDECAKHVFKHEQKQATAAASNKRRHAKSVSRFVLDSSSGSDAGCIADQRIWQRNKNAHKVERRDAQIQTDKH